MYIYTVEVKKKGSFGCPKKKGSMTCPNKKGAILIGPFFLGQRFRIILIGLCKVEANMGRRKQHPRK